VIRLCTIAALGLGLFACGEVKSDAASGDDPTITSLDPDHGPAPGGATITITGTNLAGDNPTVVVDGIAAMDAMATSNTTMTFTLPPGSGGAMVDVEVATDHGFATKPAAFRYSLEPVILDISPKTGRFAGGTAVTITGRGFQANEADVPVVTIGGSPATAVQIIDDKTITATTAASDTQAIAFIPGDVQVKNKNGTAVAPKSFSLTKQGILLVSSQSQQMAFLDPTTKNVVPFSTTSRLPNCAIAPTGTLLALRTRDSQHHDLVDYDPIVRTTTVLGQLMDGASARDFNSLAFVGNTAYVTSRQLQRLYSVNTATAALTVIGATNPILNQRSGIAPKDGSNLWLARATNGTLDTINVATGAITTGVTLSGAPPQGVRGIVTVGGVLYVATSQSSPTLVYTVNTSTGALTQFASVSLQSVTGMCLTPTAF
jgi:hypothetical protein